MAALKLKMSALSFEAERIGLSLGEPGWFDYLFRPSYCEAVQSFKSLMARIKLMLVKMPSLEIQGHAHINPVWVPGNNYEFRSFINLTLSFIISIRRVILKIANSDMDNEIKHRYTVILSHIVEALSGTIIRIG
jgi:hypothetical protein